MPRTVQRLSARTVSTTKKPGRHADGHGLYLVVDKSGAKRWVFMTWAGGRQVETGLGGLSSVSPAMARERAQTCRHLVATGRPAKEFRSSSAKRPTFGEMADQVVASLEGGWRNEKHRAQWRMTLKVYAAPIRNKTVSDVNVEDVLGILRPIWLEKAETASRIRGRIEKVLDAAKAKGFRAGENPARWRGHLDHLLARRVRLQRGHHPAMAWAAVPAFMARLRDTPSVSARALEFLILTAARSGEILKSKRGDHIRGARWSEVDAQNAVWTVPGDRMKAGRDHRVPLSPRAMAIFAEMKAARTCDFIFPGLDGKNPLSNMALEAVLRRMALKPAVTVHGFRSSFRDWAGEATDYPRELAEAALAHTVGDTVERAYRRGDALAKRREMMNSWAAFCAGAENTGCAVEN
jgi:integrase